MSDTTASLLGSGVSQQLQQSGQAAARTTSTTDSELDGGFSTVFQDVIDQDATQSAAESTSVTADATAMAALPLQPLIVNGVTAVDTQNITADGLENAELLLSTGMPIGNTLPANMPSVAWSGYVAVADNNGATAQAFAGDGDVVIQSPMTIDRQLSGSIQRSQQSLKDFLALQPTSISVNNQAIIPAQAGDFMQQLAAMGKDRQLTDISALQAMPQNASNSFASQFVTTPLTDIGLGLTTAVRGNEGMQLVPQHPNWGQELGDRVHWMIGRQMQSAEIRLNPPELGSLEVSIKVKGDHATVSFVSPHSVVRDAIDAALPRLREMLAEAGVNLADVHVSSQSHGGQHGQDTGQSAGSHRAGEGLGDTAPVGSVANEPVVRTTGLGMVDVYA